MLPTVSVVVPTRDRCARVLRAVDAALADLSTTEVVVVDDGSSDGTFDVLRGRAEHEPRLRPIRVDHGGHAAARQAGVEHAKGEVVLLLDDDVIAAPSLVTGHARHHEGRGGHVAVGYMPTRCPSPRRPGQFATFVYADNYEWHTRRWDADPTSVLPTLWGGNVSLRRDDALDVGLVADGPPIPYREDQELGVRLAQAGLRGEFDRTLLAWHEHVRDLNSFLAEARNRAIGAVLVHRLHPDELGPVDLRRYEASLPAPARWAVRLGHRRAVARLEIAALRGLIVGTGVARWWKLESLAAVVAMHILEIRAIIEAGGATR